MQSLTVQTEEDEQSSVAPTASDQSKSGPVSRTAPSHLPSIHLLIRPPSVTTSAALRVTGARPGITRGEGEVTPRVSGQFIAGPKHTQKQIIHTLTYTQMDHFKLLVIFAFLNATKVEEHENMCILEIKVATFFQYHIGSVGKYSITM